MPQSNQYQAKKKFVNGGVIIEFYDGEDLKFSTTPISEEYSLLADMIQSTLAMAVGMGFIKSPR
jgi:hypothetical protein